MKQYLLFLRSVLLFLLLAVGAGQVMAGNYLPGTWNNWSETDDIVKFTDGSLTLTLAANTTYEFKIYDTGTKGQSQDWYGNEGTMTLDNHSNWRFDKDHNCSITTTVGGSYTFTISWNEETPKKPYISVTYPIDYTISTGTATHCSISDFTYANETVSFTVTPETTSDYSYSVTDVTVTDANDKPVTVTKSIDPSTLVATCSFTMPSSNVNVSAVANDIIVSQKGKTVSGNLEGNLIIKNSEDGGKFDITFDNVQTLSSDNKWKSSIIVYNTGKTGNNDGQKPEIKIILKGTNAFINSTKQGFIINPKLSNGTEERKPCVVYFASSHEQATFYIGSNNANCKALIDEFYDPMREQLSSSFSGETLDNLLVGYRSYINIDQTSDKIDNLYYRTNVVSNNETNPQFTKHTQEGTSTAFSSFIDACKTQYQFVKFTLNPVNDIRTVSSSWITACYPYNCTVNNGEIYEAYGKVLWTQKDSLDGIIPVGVDGKNQYKVGDLRHLILKLCDTADQGKVLAGHPYFVRKISDSNDDITFSITNDNTNIYTKPTKYKGFIGVYEQKIMENYSYFLNGSQMLQKSPDWNSYVSCYRAYFPIATFSELDDFKIEKNEEGYDVYRRSGGSGQTSKVDMEGLLILGEEETTTLINEINNKPKTSSRYYDLTGRRVHNPLKGGLYIVNGKKVLY